MNQQPLEIIKFFSIIRPKGLLNVGSIHPEGGAPIMQTFNMPRQLPEATHFIIESNKNGLNCYIEPNPPAGVINKKAKATDIAQVEYLIADIDPDCTDGYEIGYRDVIDNTYSLVMMDPLTPFAVIHTGNGIQVYYRLDEPSTDFDKCYQMNKRLAKKFGGDSTYSVDHLFRIPGTLNYPNQTKLNKGYPETPSMSRILFLGGTHVES